MQQVVDRSGWAQRQRQLSSESIMHDILRERLWRNLEALPEERLYQVLDYVEFLSSKYARSEIRSPSPFRRFGERLEDHMRMNGVAFGAIRGTLDVMGTADRVVSDLTDVGRSLLREFEQGLRTVPEEPRDKTEVRSLPSGGLQRGVDDP